MIRFWVRAGSESEELPLNHWRDRPPLFYLSVYPREPSLNLVNNSYRSRSGKRALRRRRYVQPLPSSPPPADSKINRLVYLL